MSLLNQTVTVYGADGSRRVLTHCQLTVQEGVSQDVLGHHRRRRFLLIVRGDADLRPGDRVAEGELDIPVELADPVTVGYVKKFPWGNGISHTEAGGVYDRY